MSLSTEVVTLIGSVAAALLGAVSAVAAGYFGWRGNAELAALRVALAQAEATATRREAKIDQLKAALAEEREADHG